MSKIMERVHCTNLAQWQVQAAKQGGLRALLLPVKPQLPEWVQWVRCDTLDSGHYGFYCEDQECRCPLGRPGDVILGRECFAAIWPDELPDGWTVDDDGTERGLYISECRIEYRADGDPDRLPGDWTPDCRDDPECPRWLPATRLPREFARWHFTNAGVRVVQLADVSEGDALACGTERWTKDGVLPVAQLQERWRSRYFSPWESAWAWLVRLEEASYEDKRDKNGSGIR